MQSRGLSVASPTSYRWNAGLILKTCRESWRLFFLALLVILIYAPVLKGLVSQSYKDPNYAHVFAVPFFSAYLVWLKRHDLAAMKKKPSIVGLFVVLGALGLLFLGSLGAEQFLMRTSLVMTIFGLVLYFLGWANVRLLAFPLGFLLLMVPLPAIIFNNIVFSLQLLASRLAETFLKTIRAFPVLRDGNLLILSNCTLEVVEACSGIRFLMVLVALALAYGYLAERSLVIRAVLAFGMVPVAIVSNAFRVVVIAFLARHGCAESGEGFSHPIFGMVIFMVATLLLLALHGSIVVMRRWVKLHEDA